MASMNNDCTEIDELLLQIADYKNDFASVAAEKFLWKCSTSRAYQYLQGRVHEPSILDSGRQQLRRIVKKIGVQIHQSREHGWTHEYL